MIRGWYLAAAVFALAGWSRNARAAPGDATRLEYARSARAAHCPDQDALKSAVAKRLGYNPFFPAARQSIVVEITDAEYGDLRAQMHLIDEQGMIVGSSELRERVEHCDELVASLALAISIALDPSAALGAAPNTVDSAADSAIGSVASENTEKETKSKLSPAGNERRVQIDSPTPSRAPDGASKKPRAPIKEALQRPAHRIPVGLRAGGFGAIGIAPATAFGWTIGASIRSDWLKVSAEFADQLPSSKEVRGGQARASMLASKLAPCVVRDTFAGCALFYMGAFKSEGGGIVDPLRQTSLFVAFGGRVEYTPLLFGGLHLLTSVDVLKTTTPLTLRLQGQGVWQAPFLSEVATVGLEINLP